MMKQSINRIIVWCAVVGLLVSCNAEPKPIVLGKYNCDFCQMMVADARFGSEILTKKGKTFIFDDLHCMLAYVKEHHMNGEIKDFYVSDFAGDHRLIKANESFIFKSEDLRSPMGGNMAAFSDKEKMQQDMEQYKGTVVSWGDLIK